MSMNDKSREILLDAKGTGESGELSACCGAGTYGDYDICEECGEHC